MGLSRKGRCGKLHSILHKNCQGCKCQVYVLAINVVSLVNFVIYTLSWSQGSKHSLDTVNHACRKPKNHNFLWSAECSSIIFVLLIVLLQDVTIHMHYNKLSMHRFSPFSEKVQPLFLKINPDGPSLTCICTLQCDMCGSISKKGTGRGKRLQCMEELL